MENRGTDLAEFKHAGQVIKVLRNGLFKTAHDGVFDSLKQAEEAINETLKQNARVDCNLSVLSSDGKPMVLRRIHQGTGNWLDDKGKQYQGRVVYLLGAKDTFRVLDQAYQEYQAARAALKPFEIRVESYGRKDAATIQAAQESVSKAVKEADARDMNIQTSQGRSKGLST